MTRVLKGEAPGNELRIATQEGFELIGASRQTRHYGGMREIITPPARFRGGVSSGLRSQNLAQKSALEPLAGMSQVRLDEAGGRDDDLCA
jgi:hypothetical protein